MNTFPLNHSGRRLVRGVILWMICLAVFWGQTSPAQAQAREVVLVLDDSGSMRQNDPKGLSKQAGEMYVRLMDNEGSLAVITFAGSSNVVFPMTRLIDEEAKQGAFSAISAMRFSGALTNIENAVETAFAQFSKGSDRQQVLLLMTDGMIDLDNNQRRTTPEELASRRRILDTWATRYKEGGIPVYTIAFGHETDEPLLRDLAKATGGMFFKISKEADVSPVYFKIFSQVEKPQLAPITGGGFNVDSSIREATVVIEAPTDPDAVVIEDPKGRRYRRSVPTNKVRWGGSDTYLLATISKPREGFWRVAGIEESGGKVIVLTDVKLLAPEPRGVYAQNEPVYLLARMDLGIGDATLPIDLRIRAELVDDTGMIMEVAPMVNDGRGDCEEGEVDRLEDAYFSGVFPATEARREGLYTVRITAEADTFSRQREYSVRINPTPWLEFDAGALEAKPGHPLTLPFRFASEILETPGFRLHEQNTVLPPMIDTRTPFTARVQDPAGNWFEGSISLFGEDQRFLLSLSAPPVEGDYLVEVNAQTGNTSLVCFAQQTRIMVSVAFPVGTSPGETFKIGTIGYVGMGFGVVLVILLLVLLMLNKRRTSLLIEDDEDDEFKPEVREVPKKVPESVPTPQPDPAPAPEPVQQRHVEPEPEPEPEPESEPDSTAISQSLDELMREMAKVDSLSSESLEKTATDEKPLSPRDDGDEDTDAVERDAEEEAPPKPDPIAKVEAARKITTGIDLSEIENIISKMDELAGSGKREGDGDDSALDSAPSVASIMEKSGDEEGKSAEERRAILSRREYDAIDKAIDKMQRLASLRDLTEPKPKGEPPPDGTKK